MILMMLITFYDVLKSKGLSEWYEGGDKEEKNLPCCGNPHVEFPRRGGVGGLPKEEMVCFSLFSDVQYVHV